MRTRTHLRLAVAALLALAFVTPLVPAAQKLEPIVYSIRFPDPASRTFVVDVAVPTAKRESIDLMMAIWSPGFYGLQNYADRVSGFVAKGPDGADLEVSKPTPSRWTAAFMAHSRAR